MKKLSFQKKLVLIFMLLLCLATSIIAVTSYLIARDSLNQKGEVVLKNGVEQALMLIESEYYRFKSGEISEQEAQENIKIKLIGPMKDDGTREITTKIDLGNNGYFIIYDQDGNEVMHPTLEGQNVINVVDFSDEEHFIVQEQIEMGLSGGGFTYYSWQLPHSEKIGKKVSYAQEDTYWKWIVVSTAYTIDFNKESSVIINVNILMVIILILVSAVIIISYISSITKPILAVADGMTKVSEGKFDRIQKQHSNDEIETLINGYNQMLDELQIAEQSIVKQQEKLTFLAFHDELTSLPNRNGFKEFVTKRISESDEVGFMIQLDILGLKEINSTMGFEQGDRILQLIAEYFLSQKNSNYYVSRTSSNEFCIWISHESTETIKVFINNLRNDIKSYIMSNGFYQVLDLYAVFSSYPVQGESFDKMYEKVTMAMKEVKENKDLSVKSYDINMKKTIENELSMRNHLHKAIIQKEIVPYYQGKIDYTTMRVTGVEALARWTSKELGFVSPGVFIPALSRLNLMDEFSEYMIRYVLNDYKRLMNKYNKDVSVSINISPSYFMKKSFLATLQEVIKETKVPGDKIIIEITEDVFIADYKKISSIIEQLHQMQVRISIDDFGTGYSSLNYLINVDFDEMKIDKSFIDQIIVDEKVFKLFEILCKIAEVYNYSIIAEGVETMEQLEKIKSTSLKIIQGYIFSKPEAL